ncbi:MAG TPA: hypothetical protein VFN64_09620 [Burkholderiaceae bacterium]|nr:hypothetical protein [Burkholderiaceae bacterium]
MTDREQEPREREHQESEWTSLKAWSQAIGIVGIPGTIAIFLVYVGATQVPALVQNQQQLLVEVRQNRERIAELQQAVNTLTRVAQRACAAAARDEAARQRCYED